MFKIELIVLLFFLIVSFICVFLFLRNKKQKNIENLKSLQTFAEYLERQNKEKEKWIKIQQDKLNEIIREIAIKELALENAKENLIKNLSTAQELGMSDFLEERQKLELELSDLKNTQNIIIERFRLEEEKKEKQNFYMLQVPQESLNDIKLLLEVQNKLIQKEALGKVIWKVYYENLYTSLIGRVVGSEIKTGIYKITNINTNKCYIGQAVNISNRWKQHIKRGVGAEKETNNKLYPAFKKEGLENFTFEIIEECKKEELSEKEKYWQDFYQAKEYGYSIK